MYKSIVILIIGVFLILHSAFCKAEGYNAEERFSGEYKEDYSFHYGAGAVIGGLTCYYIPDSWGLNNWQKWLIGVATASVVKGAMEVFDENPSAWDVVEYGVGAGVGGGAVLFFEWRF